MSTSHDGPEAPGAPPSGAADAPDGRDSMGAAHPLGEALGWRTLKTRYPFRSRWFHLRQDTVQVPGGSRATYTYVEDPGFVCVVALTADRNVLLIRSYRYPVDEWVWEVPAGGFGTVKDDPLASDATALGRSELIEETGYRPTGDVERVGWFWSGIGHSRSRATVIFAHPVVDDGTQTLEPTENIEVHPTPIARALAMARDGQMADGHSALAILRCESRLLAAGGG